MKTAGFWFGLACAGPLVGWAADEWVLPDQHKLDIFGLTVMLAWTGGCIARAFTFLDLD